MKLFALGGAGRICRESVLDCVLNGNFTKICIGDSNMDEAERLCKEIDSPILDCTPINVHKSDETITKLKDYDIVIDGTTISLNDLSTSCIAESGCHGMNLNGFGDEYKYHDIFEANNRIMIPGFGMTPGITNIMAASVCDKMSEIQSIRISHGAYRPIAFSTSIAETTIYEYDPALPNRVVYENGSMVQVPPFARPRMVKLPEPYGANEQYIIPHAETYTLSQYLKNKKVDLIEVRGTWPQENMRLIKALYEWGFMNNQPIELNGTHYGIMDIIGKYLVQSERGRYTSLYGYALHVEVEGWVNNELYRYRLTHTHPASDGSIPGWDGLRAYTRNVGIPMGIAAQIIASGQYTGSGVCIPEIAFKPLDIFEALSKRGILIHSEIEKL